jgi:hypothetical protein
MGGKSAYLLGESIQQRAGFCTDDIFLTNHILPIKMENMEKPQT